MANKSTSVELNIRAVDYSKKTTDQVVDSLKALNAAQKEQIESAKKGTAAASDLEKAYNATAGAIKALADQDRLIKNLDKQNEKLALATTRLEAAKKAQAEYVAGLKAGEDLTARQTAKLDQLARAVAGADSKFQTAKTNIADTAAALGKLGIDSSNTAAAQLKISQAMDAGKKSLAELKEAYAGLDAAQRRRRDQQAADAAATKAAADAQVDARNRERIADQAWADAIDRARAAQAAQLAQQQAAQSQLVTELNARIALSRQIQQETEARLAQARAIAAAATAADAAARSAATVARGRATVAAPVSLQATVQDIAAPAEAATRNVAGLEAAVAKLQARVAGINGPVKEYRQAIQEAAQAQRALSDIAGQVDAFNRQVAAVRAARTAYTEARTAVNALTAELRSGAAGDGIDSRMARAQTTLRGAAAAMGAATTAARESQAALQAAGVATNNLAQAEQNLVGQATRAAGALNSLNEAYRQNGAAVDRSTRSLTNWFTSGRTTLSYVQRLRGELLGLGASFVGLNATIGLAKDALEAYRINQAITSRLLIANGGDAKAAGDDFKYLQEQADRIGFSFAKVAPAFTKFAIAAKSANFSTQEMRFVFEKIAASSVKARLSTDEMAGVFKAFEQIMSKGTVQAEELRGQLGDRLPGAFQIAARAANMTVEEFSKAMELGQVSSDQVIGIARELGKTYGVAQAGTQGLLEAQARFDNAAHRFLTSTAEGGFVEAYSNFLAKLTNLLNSGQGDKLAQQLSAGFSAVINVIGLVADNLDLLKTAIISIIGLSFVKWIAALPALFAAAKAELILLNAQMASFNALLAGTATTGIVATLGTILRMVGLITVAFTTAYAATSSFMSYFEGRTRDAVQKTINDSNKAMDDAQRAQDAVERARGTAGEKDAVAHYSKMRDIAVAAVKAQNKAVEAAKSQGLDLKGVTPGKFEGGARETEDPGERDNTLANMVKNQKAQDKLMTKLERERRAVMKKGAKEDLQDRLDIINEKYDTERAAILKSNQNALASTIALSNIEKRANYEMATERTKFQQEQQKSGETAAHKREKLALDLNTKLTAAEADLTNARLEAAAATVPFEQRRDAAVAASLKKYDEIKVKLEGLNTLSADQRLDFEIRYKQAKAMLEEQVAQKETREEVVRLEKEMNGLLEIQKAKREAIATRAAQGAISPVQALEEANKVTAEMGPQIEALGAKTLTFAESVRKLLDPVAYARSLANLGKIMAENNTGAVTAANNLEAAQKRVNLLLEQRAANEDAIRQRQQLGLITQSQAADELNANNATFKQAILDSAAALLTFAEAAKTAGAINDEQFQKLTASANQVTVATKNALQVTKQLDEVLVNSVANNGVKAFEDLSAAIGKTVIGQQSLADGFKGAAQAAGQFFASLMKDLAMAIIRTQILKALQGMGGGIGAAATAAMGAGGRHNGGVIGQSPDTFTRRVNPGVFAGAQKFHSGGLPGLRPDEVPIIAQKGEEVLTRDDSRNVLNGGKGGGGTNAAGVRVVLLDERKNVPEAMASSDGETVIMQTIRRNLPTIKQWTR